MANTQDAAGSPAFVAPSAAVSGEVSLGAECSLWHNTTLRGDLAPIMVGVRSNIQDGAVLHVESTHPCVVGDDVTVGHGAIVHGCRIGDRCLIGMGAIILNGAEIGDECVVGAGALVTEGKKIPPRSLVIGMPARVVRSIGDEEVAKILENAASYLRLARQASAETNAEASAETIGKVQR
jgi:carbonic anhydrase/acetyltransferase-like protein (isoleucine patch superfamily)